MGPGSAVRREERRTASGTRSPFAKLRRPEPFEKCGLFKNTSPHPSLQRLADLVQHLGVLYGGGHRPWLAVGDLLDGAAQDLARPGLRQPGHGDGELER